MLWAEAGLDTRVISNGFSKLSSTAPANCKELSSWEISTDPLRDKWESDTTNHKFQTPFVNWTLTRWRRDEICSGVNSSYQKCLRSRLAFQEHWKRNKIQVDFDNPSVQFLDNKLQRLDTFRVLLIIRPKNKEPKRGESWISLLTLCSCNK